METQTCYVCGKFFDDKVKLGLHLTPCYNEAVSVRKELWHPHPLDLVDEQRYTEYMKGRFKEREHQILDAQRKGVNLVSADDFEAMRGTLGPNARGKPSRPPTRERSAAAVAQLPPPASSTGEAMPPPRASASHGDQIAQPVRVVASGVTMLRNELHSEIELLKQLRTEEQQNAAARQQEFNNLINNFNAVRSSGADVRPAPPPENTPLPQPQRQPVPLPLPQPDETRHRSAQQPPQRAAPNDAPAPYARAGAPPGGLSPGVHQAMHSSPAGGDSEELPDGRVRCGTCGKFFGKKGFQVHAQRCYRGVDDFTFSRDARFEKNHPTPNQPVPQLQDDRYSGQQGGGGGGGPQGAAQDWTQFMMTYPRPVLDEKPKTEKERNQAAADAKTKAEYAAMVSREMSGAPPPPAEEREPTVPCGKCGRYFYASRVAKHEATCVSKKKR